MAATTTKPRSPAAGRPRGSIVVLHAAWMAVLLAVAVEVVRSRIGGTSDFLVHRDELIARLVGTVGACVILAVALSWGLAARWLRPLTMGLGGLLAAPTAFYVGRTLFELAARSTGAAVPAFEPSLILIATLRAFEYASLGVFCGFLSSWKSVGFAGHAAAGLTIGLVFGPVVLFLFMNADPQNLPVGALVARGLEETAIPCGMAVLLHVADRLSRSK